MLEVMQFYHTYLSEKVFIVMIYIHVVFAVCVDYSLNVWINLWRHGRDRNNSYKQRVEEV